MLQIWAEKGMFQVTEQRLVDQAQTYNLSTPCVENTKFGNGLDRLPEGIRHVTPFVDVRVFEGSVGE